MPVRLVLNTPDVLSIPLGIPLLPYRTLLYRDFSTTETLSTENTFSLCRPAHTQMSETTPPITKSRRRQVRGDATTTYRPFALSGSPNYAAIANQTSETLNSTLSSVDEVLDGSRENRFLSDIPAMKSVLGHGNSDSDSIIRNPVPMISGTTQQCCWYCGRNVETLTIKLLKCEQCRLAKYCNRECQRGDWKLHKVKCKHLTQIVVRQGRCDVRKLLRSGALRRRLLTLSEGTVILSIRDPNITTIGDMNLTLERVRLEAPFFECESLLRVDFRGCTKLTTVGTGAFCGCSSMTTIVLPDSLMQIGMSAFQDCASLTSVVFPDSLTQICDSALAGCTSLTSVVLPDSLTQIGEQAFQDCTSLTSVVLPDSLTQLGGGAFQDCTSLTSMVLPDSLTEIGKWAFLRCSSLMSVILPDSATLGDAVFYECDALLQKTAK